MAHHVVTDTNAPVEGQAAAIVAHAEGCGPYFARFPYDVAGGREKAHEYARAWRDEHAPTALVLGFTGRIVHRLIWEDSPPKIADAALRAHRPDAGMLAALDAIPFPGGRR